MAEKEIDGYGGFGACAFLAQDRLKDRLKVGLQSRRTLASNAEIGKKMRAMYDDLLEQPLPDRFVELLNQIDQAQDQAQDRAQDRSKETSR